MRLQLLSLPSNVSERLQLAKFSYVLIMAEFPDFSRYLFDSSSFQMESSARCPEIDATDLLEMRENNQNKNTKKNTQKPERSEVRNTVL